jgi:signal transduction histidine kinase
MQRWENARLDSVFDGASALIIFTASLLLLLGKRLQKDEINFQLAYAFLVSAVIRFLDSATEDMEKTVWLHQLCAIALGFGFIGRFKKTNFITVLLTITLLLGVSVFVFADFLPSAFEGSAFSSVIIVSSFFNMTIFLAAMVLQIYKACPRNLESDSIFLSGVCFCLAALIFPFSNIWDRVWWLSQVLNFIPPILLLLSLYITHNQRLMITREKLKLALEDLQRSNKELTHFSSVAAHDLAEPLRTISSFSLLISREYGEKIGESGKDYLNFIIEGTQRMNLLIKNLLEYSRIGKIESKCKEVNSEALIDSAIKNLQLSIREQMAEVHKEALPMIHGDPVQLEQLFQNLIGNAIKYHKTNIPPKVSISATTDKNEWLFAIKDNGIGIKSEYLEQIFVMFKRLHGRDEYSGTGIGLATCKKIVELHGGRIWAESKLGEGSSFFFTLPYAK